MAAGYSPSRPPTERDVVQTISGMPVFLGVLTSTGTGVNNATTAVPFNATRTNLNNFAGTLAGKVLLLQPTAAGLILPGPDTTAVISIAQQSTTPVLSFPQSIPGVLIGANERVELTMSPTTPYLQFTSVTGTASLLVWEMV